MAETKEMELQDGLMASFSPSEVIVKANEVEHKGSCLFGKKSEMKTNGHQDCDGTSNGEKPNKEQQEAFPVGFMEEPKQSIEIKGHALPGALTENLPLTEIIVETNGAKNDSGFFCLPGKENAEETKVHPAAVEEPKHPTDNAEKTHNKAGDEKEQREEGENMKVVGQSENKDGEQYQDNEEA